MLNKYLWDGRNETGKTVINGVYYAVIKLNDSSIYETKIVAVR